jgi:hypothetical protein
MKIRSAVAFLPMFLVFATGWAQTPETLRQRYGPPDEKGRYAVRRNVGMEPVYDANGKLASATIKLIDDGTKPNSGPLQQRSTMDTRIAQAALDEIIPISKRGSRVGFLLYESGRSSQETTEYERVTIIFSNIGDPRNGGSTSSVKIIWKTSAQSMPLPCILQKNEACVMRVGWLLD